MKVQSVEHFQPRQNELLERLCSAVWRHLYSPLEGEEKHNSTKWYISSSGNICPTHRPILFPYSVIFGCLKDPEKGKKIFQELNLEVVFFFISKTQKKNEKKNEKKNIEKKEKEKIFISINNYKGNKPSMITLP